MEISNDPQAGERLENYIDQLGLLLANKRARASFAIYALGLLGDGERKSVEPIAARACADPSKCDPLHQQLLHFLTNSPWSDKKVRKFAAAHAVAAMTQREPVHAWITDDTGFLKQGTHSVGVQRQYTGSAGKTTNCQVAVSLSLATRSQHLPVDFSLYLPESWTDHRKRRQEARIPDEVGFQTKPQLALAQLRAAIAAGLPRGVWLADAAYGNSCEMRDEVRHLGLDYAVGVDATTKVFRVDSRLRPRGIAVDVRALGAVWAVTPRRFRRVTWREGTSKTLSARFAMQQVVVAHSNGEDLRQREPVWLICEWWDGKPHPDRFYLAALSNRMSCRALVRLIKDRWRTERVYEDLKGELGLDHFEGRQFPGWHHHVSVVLSCYAFLVAERSRFPPSAGRQEVDDALELAA